MKSYWRKPGLYLHIGMASAVTVQLWLSLIMHRPRNGGSYFQFNNLPHSAYALHLWCGMLALCIIILHWFWSAFDKKSISSFKHLFPYNKAGIQAIITDLKNLTQFKLPEAGSRQGLPGLIHGLGFLLVTCMAVTGGICFYRFIQGMGLQPGLDLTAIWLHSFLATFVWIYWVAHILMAIAHWVLDAQKGRA